MTDRMLLLLCHRSQANLVVCSVKDTIVQTNEDITKDPKIFLEGHILETTLAITLELKEKFKYMMSLNGLNRGPLQSIWKLTFPLSPVELFLIHAGVTENHICIEIGCLHCLPLTCLLFKFGVI